MQVRYPPLRSDPGEGAVCPMDTAWIGIVGLSEGSLRYSASKMMCCAHLRHSLSPCRSALIVAPKTLLAHWAKELTTCGVGNATREFYGSSSHDRCVSDPAMRLSNLENTYHQFMGWCLAIAYC